jgi:hypothetical protein
MFFKNGLILETSPTTATELGLHEYAEEVEDASIEGLKKILEKCQEFKDRTTQVQNSEYFKFSLKIDFSVKSLTNCEMIN